MRITDEILIKFLLNESKTEENVAVEDWLAANAANRQHYEQIKSIWEKSRNLAAKSTVDADQAWLRFRERVNYEPHVNGIDHVQSSPATTRLLHHRFRWMTVAAALLLIAGIAFFSTYKRTDNYTKIVATQAVLTKTLPDGSEITLNKHSELSYANNFTEHRSIHLRQGEAFFKVSANKLHPFTIEVGRVSVLVVGTSFNVKHINDTTEVIVETGIVKVSREKDLLELRRGEKVLIIPGAGALKKQQNNDQLYHFYQSGVLIAVNTPIREIAEKLSSTYGTNIMFKEPRIGELTLTTTFKNQSLDQIIEIICETLDLKVERNKNQIILSDNK